MQREDLIVGKKYITHTNAVIQISTNIPNLIEAFWPSGKIYKVNFPSKLKEFTVDIGDRVNFTKEDVLINKYYEVIDIIGTNIVFKKGSEKITGSIGNIYKICKKERSQNMLFKQNYNPFDWEIMVTNLPSESIIWVTGNKAYEYLINKNMELDGKGRIFISKSRIKGEDKWQSYTSPNKRIEIKEIEAFCKPLESKTNVEEKNMEKNWKEFDKENLKAGMEDAKAEIAARQRAQAKAKYTELFNSLETVNSQIETLQVTKKEIEEALALFQ